MKSYQFTFEQLLPIPIAEAWDFFSSPINLAKITPNEMAFTVTSDKDQLKTMYPGMIITYQVSPILNIKLNWMTEITYVSEGKYFIDEQRFGPYQFWHHQHHFKAVSGGTAMNDILTYGLPFGPLGQLANSIFVANKVEEIFEFRRRKVIELFGDYTTASET
ncbi:MAG: SRPBCC family protein [Pedobacter sp.]|nr:SRPBCC family protein [Pedobacter sp.]